MTSLALVTAPLWVSLGQREIYVSTQNAGFHHLCIPLFSVWRLFHSFLYVASLKPSICTFYDRITLFLLSLLQPQKIGQYLWQTFCTAAKFILNE